MTDLEIEAMEIFKKLSPENQNNLLAFTRVAYMAECSVKKSLLDFLERDDRSADATLKKFLKSNEGREEGE